MNTTVKKPGGPRKPPRGKELRERLFGGPKYVPTSYGDSDVYKTAMAEKTAQAVREAKPARRATAAAKEKASSQEGQGEGKETSS